MPGMQSKLSHVENDMITSAAAGIPADDPPAIEYMDSDILHTELHGSPERSQGEPVQTALTKARRRLT